MSLVDDAGDEHGDAVVAAGAASASGRGVASGTPGLHPAHLGGVDHDERGRALPAVDDEVGAARRVHRCDRLDARHRAELVELRQREGQAGHRGIRPDPRCGRRWSIAGPHGAEQHRREHGHRDARRRRRARARGRRWGRAARVPNRGTARGPAAPTVRADERGRAGSGRGAGTTRHATSDSSSGTAASSGSTPACAADVASPRRSSSTTAATARSSDEQFGDPAEAAAAAPPRSARARRRGLSAGARRDQQRGGRHGEHGGERATRRSRRRRRPRACRAPPPTTAAGTPIARPSSARMPRSWPTEAPRAAASSRPVRRRSNTTRAPSTSTATMTPIGPGCDRREHRVAGGRGGRRLAERRAEAARGSSTSPTVGHPAQVLPGADDAAGRSRTRRAGPAAARTRWRRSARCAPGTTPAWSSGTLRSRRPARMRRRRMRCP